MTGEDGRPMCRNGIHYLDVPRATYTLPDGRPRCRECRSARKRRARKRAKAAAEAEAARLAHEEALRREWAARRRPPAWMSREQAARYRLAVRVRQARGLMPGPPEPPATGPGEAR